MIFYKLILLLFSYHPIYIGTLSKPYFYERNPGKWYDYLLFSKCGKSCLNLVLAMRPNSMVDKMNKSIVYKNIKSFMGKKKHSHDQFLEFNLNSPSNFSFMNDNLYIYI